MTLLVCILSVVAIFISGFRGVALWAGGTFLLWFLCDRNLLLSLTEGHVSPILLIGMAIQVLSILIGRWWGLAFQVVAGVTLFGGVMISALV